MQYVTVNFRNFITSSKFPKTLVNNCQLMLRKMQKSKDLIHLHRGRSLISRIGLYYICIYIYTYICMYVYIYIYIYIYINE